MFPFTCFMDTATRQNCRKAQLEFLKMARDGLETRLAAINAAIASMEQQQSRSTSEETVQS
ncbi:MAG: hypothetical protein WCD18_13025 [Thermosynechococcaceae cyanobacterium]